MFTRVIVALVALVVAFAILGAGGQAVLTKVPPSVTSPASGKQMFDTYCASCHGVDGKGGGPVVSALKAAPPDLTQLTATNEGRYPDLKVFESIAGGSGMPAVHGSKDAPVWGDVFQPLSHTRNAANQMRVASLTAYIRSLQGK